MREFCWELRNGCVAVKRNSDFLLIPYRGCSFLMGVETNNTLRGPEGVWTTSPTLISLISFRDPSDRRTLVVDEKQLEDRTVVLISRLGFSYKFKTVAFLLTRVHRIP